MEIFKKLAEARKIIRNTNMKKAGWNDYSKYHYFTPEQISKLVADTCEQVGLIDLFSLRPDLSTITIVNLDNPEDKIEFHMKTMIPEIKATNATQQVGGAVTYLQRYLKMTAFDIQENNLDPDAQPQPKAAKQPQPQPQPQPQKTRFDIKNEKMKVTAKNSLYSKGNWQYIEQYYIISDADKKVIEDEVRLYLEEEKKKQILTNK